MPCQHSLGEGPTLVLLPGWGFSHRIWLPIAEQLATAFHVQLWDLPNGETLDAMLLNGEKQLPNSAHYVGWSLGGLVAQGLALKHPARVKSLITLGSSPRFIAEDAWPGVSSDFFTTFKQRFQENPSATFKHFALLCLASREHQKTYLQATLASMLNLTPQNVAELSQGLDVLAATDLRASPIQYPGPRLALSGSADPLNPQNPAWPQCVIEGASHIPQLTHPEQTVSLIREFLYAHANC